MYISLKYPNIMTGMISKYKTVNAVGQLGHDVSVAVSTRRLLKSKFISSFVDSSLFFDFFKYSGLSSKPFD